MESTVGVAVDLSEAPLQPDQEWANALTHGIAAIGAICFGGYLVLAALGVTAAEGQAATRGGEVISGGEAGIGLAIACGSYAAAVFGTFLFSTLSHAIHRQPMLNTLRAWDQAMIYAMISGTYTPIIYRWAGPDYRMPLLAAIWIAAGTGFLVKVAWRHRVNASGTVSYLMLGWLPAVPLIGRVPSELAWWMLAGGVLYSIGVVFLINDRKVRYLHAAWHVSVMTAALCHYFAILTFVVQVA